MGMPLCLRRVPPEACREPLIPVRWSAAAGRTLANLIPANPCVTAAWLNAVFFAARACHEPFAFWIGRQQSIIRNEKFHPTALCPLAMYAWHCGQHESAVGWLAFTPWSPRLCFAKALTETQYWFHRVKLLAYFGSQRIEDMWISGGRVCGFDFVPLTNFWQIMEERVDMGNCVDCYADKLADNGCRLFGVRHRGRSVATLELTADGGSTCFGDAGTLRIAQLKGPQNAKVPLDVWHAAMKWLAAQDQPSIDGSPLIPIDRRAGMLKERIAPYWKAIGADPANCRGLPALAPTWFETRIAELAACSRLSGWPFQQRP